jgi:cytochrome c oxidase subunit 1
MNSALSLDTHIHDTAFVVAHFHYTMFGGTLVIFFAGLHYWFPKMFGRLYNEGFAKLACVLFFFGFNATYLPLFMAGMDGMPRRYADYLSVFHGYHKASTHGSWLLALSLLVLFANLAWALFRGPKTSERNTWGGKTLEWQTATPPVVLNFEGGAVLEHGPYDYPIEVEE